MIVSSVGVYESTKVKLMVEKLKYKVDKTIALVGMMGSGKTAISHILASYLGVSSCDSDYEIEQAANMSIREIFDQYGEAFFRQKEAQVMNRLLEGKPCVLATGGGVFMSEDIRHMINKRAVSLWLDVDLDILWKRVKDKPTRPLLQCDDPYAMLCKIYNERRPIYAKAMITTRAKPHQSKTSMAKTVLSSLLQSSVSGVSKE